MTAVDPRVNRSPGISYQQLLDTDTHAVPAILRVESPRFLGDKDIPIDRYISRDFHEVEKRRLWQRVWQFACREEHIPGPGDYHIYEIATFSFIVVRQPDMTIKAYPNACLHRGRRLKDYDGHCSEIRCAFHGFAWALSGELSDVPARWDFPHVDERRETDFALPECRVGTWGGFVFINPDPDCEPLEDFLGELPSHFAHWDLEQRYVQAHVTKVIAANWKITQEAFSESYHVNATHPQILYYLGDTNSQVDIWENFSRVITPSLTPSPLLWYGVSEDEMIRSMLDVRVDQVNPIPVPDGSTARAVAAAAARERWRGTVGSRVDEMSDAEFVDNLDYTVFPNFHPWGAFNRITYRFRPNGDDHRTSIMEVLFLAPFKGERPKPAQRRDLRIDEPWTNAPELGMLAKVFDQDVFNMSKVQLGLETTRKPGVTLGNYQESKVRWIHHRLGEFVEGSD